MELMEALKIQDALDTYEVRQRVSGIDAADMMLKMFSRRTGDTLRTPSESKLTPQQVITLASIVEREVKVPSERATIASVYLNRLARDMPLQADPTVQYAVATRDGRAAAAYNYWRPLTQAELSIDSPYNTYLHTGLPPGPICSPGEPAIRAALRVTGSATYSRTTEQVGSSRLNNTQRHHAKILCGCGPNSDCWSDLRLKRGRPAPAEQELSCCE